MQAKTGNAITEEVDIDAMIQAGIEKHQELKQVAEATINKMNAFNFELDRIDTFHFQEKDFREEKKKVQQILDEQHAEVLRRQSGEGRRERAARAAARAKTGYVDVSKGTEALHDFHQAANKQGKREEKS